MTSIFGMIVEKAFNRIVHKELPALITSMTIDAVKSDPDRQLSRVGFDWALSIALRDYWPDLDGKTAVRWLKEYIGVPYGTPGYDWNYAAAKELAAQYVSEFGERP